MSFLSRVILRYGALVMVVNALMGEALAAPVRILALGDSLTAGFGLPAESAFPARLEAALRAEGRDVRLINAGVSGDTTQGGLARLTWALAEKPDLAILELGANDGLRGLDPKLTRANLDAILKRFERERIGVLFTGMLAPPNYGPAYEAEFKAVFSSLAREHGLLFYPFFLDGVTGNPRLTLPDGLHPSAQGVDEIVRRILPSVRQLLDRHAAQGGAR
ncbi:arylesterase [Paramagnetospirillum marisnigri]|uniref:Arylesterase n=1 Tax=Paramagnetospirillum marisnigri TaxID=1285242 RepID=A0A178MQN0_9PROT|nr:arylesterase [Paramagnetospirillum marisnigri]OAN50254.1 arylesterase [Paramagnetospirillum marisnigri]